MSWNKFDLNESLHSGLNITVFSSYSRESFSCNSVTCALLSLPETMADLRYIDTQRTSSTANLLEEIE